MKPKERVVYIGGVQYKVLGVDKIKGPKVPNRFILGQFNPAARTVKYRNRLGSATNVTICHELLHAISHEMDLIMEEDIVDIISRELVGTMTQLGVIK